MDEEEEEATVFGFGGVEAPFWEVGSGVDETVLVLGLAEGVVVDLLVVVFGFEFRAFFGFGVAAVVEALAVLAP